MYYKVLENVYKLEEKSNVKVVTELATYLVNTYHKEKDGYLSKKDLLIIALTNILGNLFLKYQTGEYLKKTTKEKYNEDFSPMLLFPMNNSLFVKNDYDTEKNKYVYENIKNFGLTRRNKDHIIAILKLFNICKVRIGRKQVTNTSIVINNFMDWREDIFKQSLVFNLKVYHAVARNYIIALQNPDNDFDGNISTYIKSNGKRLEAPDSLLKTTDKINKLWPIELKRFYYKRVFNNNIHTGGRFFSLFTNMSKVERKRIIADNFDFKEIDFTAFVPNSMKLFADGEAYDERPYNKTSKYLISNKKWGKVLAKFNQNALLKYEKIIADIIKIPILIMMNQENYNDKTINRNKPVWEILIENGLANTPSELKNVNDQYSSISDIKRKNQLKTIALYELRSKRWNKIYGIECPHIVVKPSTLLTATKKSLKEIDNFLLTSNWGWTQYIESEILVKLSSDLEQDKLLPLFIHDAFFVPESYYNKYSELSEKYFKEIILEYRKSILTDDYKKQLDKSLDILLKKRIKIKYTIDQYRDSYKKNNEIADSKLKRLTMEIIKYLKEDINEFKKEDGNKFYFSGDTNKYWSLYVLVNERVKEMVIS